MDVMSFIVAFLNSAVRTTTPIALATLACTLSERSGVINIGVEGMMVFSAFVAAVVSYYTGSAWVGLLGAMAAGVFIAAILGWLVIYCNGRQIVIGIGINLVGPGLAYLIMQAIWGTRGISPWLPGFAEVNIPLIKDIPILGGIVSGYDPTIYLCIGLVILMNYMIYHTAYGLRLRASGENPSVVDTVGINVFGLRMGAVLLSGALIGMAGSSLCLGSVNVFTNGMSSGRGFLAFAANQFGHWSPTGAYFASMLFGGMEALRIRLQSLNVAPQLLQMLPYVTTMLALTFARGKLRAPAANGEPYPHPISFPRAKRKK